MPAPLCIGAPDSGAKRMMLPGLESSQMGVWGLFDLENGM